MTSPKDPNILTFKTSTPVGKITISTQTNNSLIDFEQAAKRILAKRNPNGLPNIITLWDSFYMGMFCLTSYQSLYWQFLAESYAKQINHLHRQTKSAV